MNSALRTLIPLILGAALQSPSQAQEREHSSLLRGVRAGQLVPISQIRERLLARMRGYDHIGTEFDPAATIYRLKFMRNGQVVWLDVDARSGRIIGRASP